MLICLLSAILLVSGCTEPNNSLINSDDTDNEIQPPITLPETKDGLRFETAIVSDADNEDDGVAEEYEWLAEHACKNNEGVSELEMQDLQEHDGHMFDVMHMICNNNELEIYYFQIDSFFGKW